MTCTYGALDTGAATEYLNGLTGYEQTGRPEQRTLERMARLVITTGSLRLTGPLRATALKYPAGVPR